MSEPFVLASASPRRRELLARLGLRFAVEPSRVDEEDGGPGERPERVARRLAVEKAREVASRLPERAVLAADTVVAHRGLLLGKPRDPGEARAMLQRLRGRSHRVVTAVAVASPSRTRPFVGHASTRVVMRDYSDDAIDASIARGDPFDKAGAYAIQDERFSAVARFDGCYCNVVGLPLWSALALLRRAGCDVAPDPAGMPPACRSCPQAATMERPRPGRGKEAP